MSKEKELDQFYTNKKVAIDCYNELNKIIQIKEYFLFEPSAGTGSFSSLFHSNSLSIDLEPKDKNINKQDFLTLDINFFENKKVITIGNPPFGKKTSLAIKFFNKSAKFSEYIGFILPKTFKKKSVINKLDKNMFLIFENELDKNSFVFKNEKYDVPCIFQIWKKENKEREKQQIKNKSDYFLFTTKTEANFAIRRIGSLAGKVITDYKNYKESSHYFIKASDEIKDKINTLYKSLNNVSKNTAGNPSLSKDELINILENYIKRN